MSESELAGPQPVVYCDQRRKGQTHCDRCGARLRTSNEYAECTPCRNNTDRFYERNAKEQLDEAKTYGLLTPEQREKHIAKCKEYRENLSPEQREELRRKNRERSRKWRELKKKRL